MTLRETAKNLFLTSLRATDVGAAMARSVEATRSTIRLGSSDYSFTDFDDVIVIAIGKAAHSMWDAFWKAIQQTTIQTRTKAIVVGPICPKEGRSATIFVEGSHPYPDETSLMAAELILSALASATSRTLVVFLISGGSSAMVERMLDPAVTFADLASFSRSLVKSGLPIAEMNALRKHLSAVKGGRLAAAAQPASQCTLLISDVPAEMLHSVGSGPSLPDPSTTQECKEVLGATFREGDLPLSVVRFFSNSPPETVKPGAAAFCRSAWYPILSSDDLCQAAAAAARSAGFLPIVDNTCDEWHYEEAAKHLLGRLRRELAQSERVCIISAGEVSVPVPSDSGRGGRNQHFALECARLLYEQPCEAAVVSAGSDGIDGNSEAAGAVSDNETFERASRNGLDAMSALRTFDSNQIFRALGDDIVTGPTGNNLRDLRILIAGRS